MAKILKFEDLEIWQQGRAICKFVECLFEETNLGKRYSLMNQMDRSSGSVMDNIAEGFEREGNKEFVHFLTISKGSCGESRSQLYRAFDRKYISEVELNDLKEISINLSKSISGFMNYLKKSEYKGNKFNK
jgi:four helix bundle protein